MAPPLTAPLSVIKIVKYCSVRGGGALGGAPKSYKYNSVPHLCYYDSKVFWNRGGGHWGALKSYKMIMASPLSVIIIVSIVGKNIMPINNTIVYCLTDACEL